MQKKFLTLFGTALTLALSSNIAFAQSPGESSGAANEIKMSAEGMEILCKRFPMNSRCGGGAAQAQPTTPTSVPETPAEGTSGRMKPRTTPEVVPAPAPVPPPGAVDTPTNTPGSSPEPGNMNTPVTPVPESLPGSVAPSGSPTEPMPDSMTTPSGKPEEAPSTEKVPVPSGDSERPTGTTPSQK
ncbi:MAG: hypothetical protein VKL59_24905 [Nostocaceae cyanobacterium]|nr:hypothetical protein [Nostocaceae cyanobacterium]